MTKYFGITLTALFIIYVVLEFFLMSKQLDANKEKAGVRRKKRNIYFVIGLLMLLHATLMFVCKSPHAVKETFDNTLYVAPRPWERQVTELPTPPIRDDTWYSFGTLTDMADPIEYYSGIGFLVAIVAVWFWLAYKANKKKEAAIE